MRIHIPAVAELLLNTNQLSICDGLDAVKLEHCSNSINGIWQSMFGLLLQSMTN